jgi:hypothetical protein
MRLKPRLPKYKAEMPDTTAEVLYEPKYWPDLKQAKVMPKGLAIQHVFYDSHKR